MSKSASGKKAVSKSPEQLPEQARPFLKWVGGKRQLLPELVSRLPDSYKRYHEPFIGGGALFFHLCPRRASISDINPELINVYSAVKNDVEALIRDLRRHRYEKEYFYRVRDSDREPSFKRWSPVKRASRLIFLNKTCFNGLYRVNSSGQFNTPFGRYVNPAILDADNLRACSRALQSAKIQLAPFDEIEEKAKSGDLVYFDPPYVPLSATASFTGYSQDGFSADMQRELAALCSRLDKAGVQFMLSNSSAPLVLSLYRKFRLEKVDASRAINSRAHGRGKIHEVIVRNY